ncbi:hypothetical protein TNCV_3217151 [Trichonephila clavipes]|nr:hypothetical protein TNCV_3217151 [Trichonephila clavipes]
MYATNYVMTNNEWRDITVNSDASFMTENTNVFEADVTLAASRRKQQGNSGSALPSGGRQAKVSVRMCGLLDGH